MIATHRLALVLHTLIADGPSVRLPSPQGTPPASVVDSIRAQIDRAFFAASVEGLSAAIARADVAVARSADNAELLHYKGFAQFRKASLLLQDKTRRSEAKQLFEAADRTLEASLKTLPWPETLALRASCIGQLVAFGGPLGAVRLGRRSNGLMDQALRLGPHNPRVLMLKGVSEIFKPGLFGGGLDKAERHLGDAIARFDGERPAPSLPVWGRAEAHAWLGQVYARSRRPDEARIAYRRAQEIAPGFEWVARTLLPQLDAASR